MAAAGRPEPPQTLVLLPGDPAGLAARAALRFHAGKLLGRQSEATRGEDEAVHQLHIAVRRMRAALFLFGSLAPELALPALMRDLGTLGHLVGAVRSLDVLLEILKRRARKLDRAMTGELEPLEKMACEARAAAFLKLVRALRGKRCGSINARLLAIAPDSDADPLPLREIAGRLLRPMLRNMTRAGRRLGENSAPDEFHRLRVRAKRVRYAMEMLRPLGGKPAKKLLRRLQNLQLDFGVLQDTEETLTWIRTHAELPGVAPAAMITAGALIYALERRARKLRRRALWRWERVSGGGLVRSAIRDLSQPAKAPAGAPGAGRT